MTATTTTSSLHFPVNAASRDAWPPNGYDWTQPTVVVYKDTTTHTTANFAREFATARQKLDYGYHDPLVLQRQLLQDVVLKRIIAAAATTGTATATGTPNASPPAQQQQRPWMIFTAGAMGAGKGYCMAHLSSYLDLPSYVQIDPDKLKQELPELPGYLDADPATAGTKLHPESTHMADVLLEHALQSKQPILIDGSLRDVVYYTSFFQRIRRDYPHYRLAILHVTAEPHRVRQRAVQRARLTGRAVPHAILSASLVQVPRSVAALAPFTDALHVVANDATLQWERSVLRDGTTGKIVETIETPPPGSWERLGALFGVEQQQPRSSSTSQSSTTTPASQNPTAPTTTTVATVAPTMAATFTCTKSHDTARLLWQAAYPNACVRCALACDGQCGLCRHGIHLCHPCAACGRTQPPCDSVEGDDNDK